jgi:hypothetical protein
MGEISNIEWTDAISLKRIADDLAYLRGLADEARRKELGL